MKLFISPRELSLLELLIKIILIISVIFYLSIGFINGYINPLSHFWWPVIPPNDVMGDKVYLHKLSKNDNFIYALLINLFYLFVCNLTGWKLFGKKIYDNYTSYKNIPIKILIFNSSFVLIYPLIVASTRVLSIFIDYNLLVYITIFFYLIIILGEFNNFKSKSNLFSKNIISYLLFFIFLLTSFIVMQVQPFSHHYLTGDATRFYIDFAKILIPDLSYIPLINYHYDEFIFNFFPTIIINYKYDDISLYMPYWLLESYFKFSFFSLLIIFFCHMNCKIHESILITLFIFFGNFSSYPFSMLHLSDSVTPLVNSLQSGRIFNDFMFIPIGYVFLSLNYFNHRLFKIFILFILGIGLSSLTQGVSVELLSFSVIWYFSIFFINSNFKYLTNRLLFKKYLIILISVTILFIPIIFNYDINLTYRIFFLVLLILVTSFIGILVPCYLINNFPKNYVFIITNNLKFLIMGLFFGFLFLGGPLISISQPYINGLFEYFPLIHTSYDIDFLFRDAYFESPIFFDSYSDHLPYLKDIKHFYTYFAVIFLFILLYLFNYEYIKNNTYINVLNFAFIFYLISFILGMIILKFVDFQGSIGGLNHLKTRFIEPYIYGLLTVIFISISKNSFNIFKNIFYAILLLLIILPQLGTYKFYKQFFVNIKYLLSLF